MIKSVGTGKVAISHERARIGLAEPFFSQLCRRPFGPLLAVALADRGRMPATIGFVLTASGFAGCDQVYCVLRLAM